MKKLLLMNMLIALTLFTAACGATEESEPEEKDVEVVEEATETEVASTSTEAEEEEPEVEEEPEEAPKEEEEPEIDEELIQLGLDYEAYSEELIPLSDSIGASFGEFSVLMDEAAIDPYVMFNDEWVMDIALILLQMDTDIQAIRSLDVPESMSKIHDPVLKAMDEYDYFVTNFPTAFDTMDFDLIEECITRIENGNSFIGEATLMMDELKAEFDISI